MGKRYLIQKKKVLIKFDRAAARIMIPQVYVLVSFVHNKLRVLIGGLERFVDLAD